MSNLNESLDTILATSPQRLVLSKQTSKTQPYRKVTVEKIQKSEKTGDVYYQIAQYTQKQVFHENCTDHELAGYLQQTMGTQFLQLNA